MKELEPGFFKKGGVAWASTYGIITLISPIAEGLPFSPFYAIVRYVHRVVSHPHFAHPGPIPMTMMIGYLKALAVLGVVSIPLSLSVLWLAGREGFKNWKSMALSMAVWPLLLPFVFTAVASTVSAFGIFFVMIIVYLPSVGLSELILHFLDSGLFSGV